MRLLYNISLFFFMLGIRLASRFQPKARLWLEGRRHWQVRMQEMLKPGEQRIWIHCSSLGEFEQGRPLIEAFRRQYPAYKIVLTFFSPSGYEIRKHYDQAEYVFYLPMDSASAARIFIDMVQPSLAVFVKYEFWYYYLRQLRKKEIPTILVSAAFRKNQLFFKWYGSFFREMLRCFSLLFVQDQTSRILLAETGFTRNVLVAGDTRYDRVASIALLPKDLDVVARFAAGGQLLVAGSTWPGDEAMLASVWPSVPSGWRLVIAPHEIDKAHITQIRLRFPGSLLYSELAAHPGTPVTASVLIIDNIGMLSRLYAYGSVAFIGGGFQKGGIHNILEPAVFGLPVLMGPVYRKFVEALSFVAEGYAFPVKDAAECNAVLARLLTDDAYRERLQEEIRQYMHRQTGATNRIMAQLEADGLL